MHSTPLIARADRDRIESVWYRRAERLPSALFRGRRVMLHFENVAFACDVFVNGRKIGSNYDGFLPFDLDATDAARLDADNEILLRVGAAKEAYSRGWPVGAMSPWQGGIAGACWIEPVPPASIAGNLARAAAFTAAVSRWAEGDSWAQCCQ